MSSARFAHGARREKRARAASGRVFVCACSLPKGRASRLLLLPEYTPSKHWTSQVSPISCAVPSGCHLTIGIGSMNHSACRPAPVIALLATLIASPVGAEGAPVDVEAAVAPTVAASTSPPVGVQVA